jgi:uncharacterized membrane protein (UPF0136 family)
MMLAATTVPIELQQPDVTQLSVAAFRADVVLNIVGYLPLGVVLATLGPARVAAAAATIATLAEAGQLFMMHRQPSAVDVVCNVVGATLGAMAASRYRRTSPLLTLNHRAAAVAVVLAAAVMILVWSRSPVPLNDRGWTASGTLEAHWKFDESEGRLAVDSSGHGLEGAFSNEPKRVLGMRGHAVSLDGATDYIGFGRDTAFRLVGSVTISAWINVASFPRDDAAIVSSHNGIGYQLDTTVDRGPRTIGFKLGNACGHLMARYGKTPLVVGRWYHLAGVYDAPAKTLDVYLDGKPDNGFLLGTVTAAQRSSREAVYIGRRSSDRGFEFAGLIDDVRVYSRALTNAEIDALTRGMRVESGLPLSGGSVDRDSGGPVASRSCGRSDREDSQIPGAAGVLGVLIAVMYFGFWPTAGWLPCLLVSVVAGMLLLLGAAPSLPALGRWLIPLTSLAGTASVLASLSED